MSSNIDCPYPNVTGVPAPHSFETTAVSCSCSFLKTMMGEFDAKRVVYLGNVNRMSIKSCFPCLLIGAYIKQKHAESHETRFCSLCVTGLGISFVSSFFLPCLQIQIHDCQVYYDIEQTLSIHGHECIFLVVYYSYYIENWWVGGGIKSVDRERQTYTSRYVKFEFTTGYF